MAELVSEEEDIEALKEEQRGAFVQDDLPKAKRQKKTPAAKRGKRDPNAPKKVWLFDRLHHNLLMWISIFYVYETNKPMLCISDYVFYISDYHKSMLFIYQTIINSKY